MQAYFFFFFRRRECEGSIINKSYNFANVCYMCGRTAFKMITTPTEKSNFFPCWRFKVITGKILRTQSNFKYIYELSYT